MERIRLMVLLVTLASAHADEVLVPLTLHTNESSLELTLTVQGVADADTEPLGGDILLAVDCFAPLAAVSLRDFRLRATTNFNVHLDYGAFGDIFGTLTNLEVLHAAPGPQQPYQPVVGETVTFQDVPRLLAGITKYRATGLACVALQGNGLPCNDVIDLGQPPRPDTIGRWQGTLILSNSVLRFEGGFRFSGVVLPESPDLARIDGYAQVIASGIVRPCLRIQPGFFSGEHLVSWSSAFPNFRLYRATSLTLPVQWEPVDEFFIRDDGTLVSALLTAEGRSAFYRLSNE